MVPASPNFLGPLYESNTEGTNFLFMFVYFTFIVKCARFVFLTSARFNLVKIPGDPVQLTGL